MKSSPIRVPMKPDPLLSGGGDCGRLLRGMDWTTHPLGPVETWPPELRTVVGIALGSKQPMLIVWGPEQSTLYNDGYAAMCGTRHPAAMGRPFRDLWFDIWDQVDPIITAAYNGVSTSMENIEFVMHRNGYPEETHFAFSYSPVRDSAGAVLGMFCACAETTGQVMMQRRLATERAQMRQIFENALGAVAIVSGPDHVFTFTNDEYQQLVGDRPVLGRRVADALPDIVDQGFLRLLDTVLETGEAYVGRHLEYELPRAGKSAERRVVDLSYHPISGADGRAEGIFVQAIDTTERANAERQQQILNHEIAHRMKNQLAVVQAVANQTLRSAPDLDAARASLSGRLGVLGRAQDMVLSGTVKATTITAIVEEVISLHADPAHGAFTISGPDLAVGSRAALSLSLMLHELFTNAAKHGALSVESGRVDIAWRTDMTLEGDCFALDWQEAGGPPIPTPTRIGSGTRLLKAGVSGARFCRVNLTYEPSGARCEIRLDMEGLQS